MMFYFCPHADILGNFAQLGGSTEPETNGVGDIFLSEVP